MSAYRLTIKKLDDDPNYEEKVKRYEESRRYGQSGPYMEDTGIARQIETRTLTVELTPEEYAAVLRAVVTHWDQKEESA